MIALINYLSQILVELVKLANLIVQLSKAVVSSGRIAQILDTKPSMQYKSVTEDSGDTALAFENVSLRYGGASENSLTNISFSAKRGETVGIIGGTGSGKTTLVSLAARFYDATEGRIEFMGADIRDWDKKAIRKRVAVVMQRAQLFSGTVRSNLLYGSPSADDDELWAALEAAQAADFVRMKDGMLDAEVEQGGRNFSGGQRQRLCVARAIAAKPTCLFLTTAPRRLITQPTPPCAAR